MQCRRACDHATERPLLGDIVNRLNNFVTVNFATDDLPEKDRVALWREHFGQTAFRVEIEPRKDLPFHACVSSTTIPGLQLMRGAMSAASVTRTKAYISDGNSDLAFVVNRTGSTVVSARGRDLVLREGDAVLLSSDEVTTFDRNDCGSSCSLRLSRSILSSLVAHVEDAVMVRIPEHHEALRMLAGYVMTLQDEACLATPELRQLAASHIYDLVAITLGATRDAEETAKARGVRAMLFESAKAFIVQNCHRQDLSLRSVAAHVGITPRYLQRLFEGAGNTFSRFLLDTRLARAHRMLAAPVFSAHAVSTIAYDAGFGDLSYFNRSFRKLYGTTPLGVRHAAKEWTPQRAV